MSKRMPETCWAVLKRQAINLRDWCIWLFGLFEYMMMHGLTNPKFKWNSKTFTTFRNFEIKNKNNVYRMRVALGYQMLFTTQIMSRPALGPTQSPVQWIPGLPRVKVWPGRDADPHRIQMLLVMKEYSYTSTPPMGRTDCTEPQYSYTSTPPMDSTACTEPQYSYTSTPLMGRTACTEPQYSYTSTAPMDRTACTEPQCLYKCAICLFYKPNTALWMGCGISKQSWPFNSTRKYYG
jgi:hypothetical protein